MITLTYLNAAKKMSVVTANSFVISQFVEAEFTEQYVGQSRWVGIWPFRHVETDATTTYVDTVNEHQLAVSSAACGRETKEDETIQAQAYIPMITLDRTMNAFQNYKNIIKIEPTILREIELTKQIFRSGLDQPAISKLGNVELKSVKISAKPNCSGVIDLRPFQLG